MDGILVINKPAGMTSHDVINNITEQIALQLEHGENGVNREETDGKRNTEYL